MKLAQNQTELSNQISELKGVVELQGQMLNRLLAVLEREEGEGPGKGKGKQS